MSTRWPTTAFSRLSLRQIMLIAAIDGSGSLKRAAERIGMSQPRATKALREIEALTERQLFVRTNRGLLPTIAGDCIIRHATILLAQLSSLEEEMQGLSGVEWSQLRIGTIMGAVPYVTERISDHLRRFPQTRIEIVEDTSVELLRLLDRGLLDLVIGRSSVTPTPQHYNSTAFHDETLSVVANPSHPLVRKKRVSLEDLKASRWIVYTAAMPMRLLLEREFRHAGLAFPVALLETRSALATMSLIQADPNTVALLSSDVAGFFVEFGMARTLPMRLSSRSEPYEVITRREIGPSDAVQRFIADLIAGAPSGEGEP